MRCLKKFDPSVTYRTYVRNPEWIAMEVARRSLELDQRGSLMLFTVEDDFPNGALTSSSEALSISRRARYPARLTA
jgi:hypothetical protein